MTVVHFAVTCTFAGADVNGLDVNVSFQTPHTGHVGFGWQPEWAGESRLAQWERGFAVGGATKVNQDTPGHWSIEARPEAALEVTYHVVSGYDRIPTAREIKQAWPLIQSGWFQVIGHALFGFPDGSEHISATFDWRCNSALPFDSDLLHLSDRRGRRRGNGTVSDVLDSVLIGGRDVHLFSNSATQSHLAVAGNLPAALADMPQLLSKTLEVEYDFWRETARPFLATAIILPNEPGSNAYSGTGLGDALALRLGGQTKRADLIVLIAHEFFHHWNPDQLGHVDLGNGTSKDEEVAWLGEGFTDYYAYQLTFRAGLLSSQDWLNFWDTTLRNYARSPLRRVPNEITAAQYWSSSAGTQIPYLRGKLLALLWNEKLLRLTSGRYGLDDVMRDLRRRASTATERIDQELQRTIRLHGPDLSADFDMYIKKGEPIVLPADLFGSCAVVRTTEMPAFDAGFDLQATLQAKGVATGVDPTSRAYAAGLRNGMQLILPLTGRIGDSSRKWSVKVQGGALQTIEYYPQAANTVPLQSVELAKPVSETCIMYLSGKSDGVDPKGHL